MVALGFAIAAVVFLSVPSFAAGAVLGGFYIYSSMLPAGYGFVTVFAALLICWLLALWRGEVRAAIPHTTRVYAYSLILAAVVFIRQASGDDSILGNGRNLLGFIGIGLVVSLFASTKVASRRFSLGFVVACAVFTIFEMLRVLQGGALHTMMVAFGANPIFVGHFLAIALLLCIVLWFDRRVNRAFLYVLGAIVGLGLLLLASMGPIVGLVVAVSYWALLGNPSKNEQQAAKKYLSFVGIVVLAYFLQGTLAEVRGADATDASIGSRTERWSAAITHIRESPLWGQGTDLVYTTARVGDFTVRESPHNIYLEIWMTTGLVPALLLILLVVLMARSNGPAGRAVLIIAVFGFSVSGSVNETFNFWSAFALATIATKLMTLDKPKEVDEYSGGVGIAFPEAADSNHSPGAGRRPSAGSLWV